MSPVDEETKKCCDEGVTTLCVNGDQATCCDGECCGPDNQETCCSGQCCRDSLCCDADWYCCPVGPPSCGPVGACCLDNEGTCTEVNQTCCDSMGGIAWAEGVPCDSSLCLPVCDNCQEYQRTFDECHHWANDPDGAACSVIECIHNVICSASCTHHDDRTGPPHCDTALVPGEPEAIQYSYWMPCPGGVVSWHVFWEPYDGCGETCNRRLPKADSCLTEGCSGEEEFLPPIRRPTQRTCGCPT